MKSTKKTSVPDQRSRNFVFKSLQGALLWRVGVHWIILAVINILAIAIWIRLVETPDSNWSSVFKLCIQRYLPCVIVTLALLPAFILDSIKLSNRFAGPIYRIAGVLNAIGDNRSAETLRFRKDDFLHEIADDLNTILKDKLIVPDQPLSSDDSIATR